MRVGVYVRISRDYEGKGLGVARQEEDCRKKAADLGWEVADVYIDNDASATSGKKRPAYQRMLSDLESGDIGGIVVWHPDRLYRRLHDLLPLMDLCKKVNAQIQPVTSGDLDLSTSTGRMIASILASVATQEVEHKSERWARAWQQGREAGAPVTNSTRLFGYERDGATIVPGEAEAAREMVERMLRGDSMQSVLRWLYAEGIRTSQGGVWRTAALKFYLRNPRIAGWSTHKGEIVARGQWEPIIEPERWEELRAILESRTRTYFPRRNLLPGLVFCGLCGSRLISGRSREVRHYRCSTRPDFSGCGKVAVYCEPVEEIVEAYARERLESPEVRRRVAELQAHPSGAQNELVALGERIIELERELDATDGRAVSVIVRALDRARRRQEELLAEVSAAPAVELPQVGGPWPEDLKRRRLLVETVVARVDIVKAPRLQNAFNPERVQITPH